MEDNPGQTIYGIRWTKEGAKLSRTFDIIVAIILLLAVAGATHLHFMLLAGDWDFWVDWKDREFWVTLTPIVAIMFPAALQYMFWKYFRLPIAATLAMVGLMIGEWLNRYYGFHLWSYFPMSMVWPAMLIPSALALDAILLLTGNFLLTAIFGGMAFSLLFYPANWFMLAPYRLPVQIMDYLASVGDVMGYSFTRTATPEYLRMIERGTLRTFGGHSATVSAFFSGFVCILTYMVWWGFGVLFSRVIIIPNTFKKLLGLVPRAAKTSKDPLSKGGSLATSTTGEV